MKHLAIAIVIGLVLAACGSKDAGKPAPEQPFTGAPVAFVVDSIEKEGVKGRAYNFSDKTVASYQFVVQYKDKDGKVLKVKPGTPFEKDFDFMSMSGRKYSAKPKSWVELEIDMLEVPAGAATAEVMVTRVGAIDAGGTRIEDLWEYEGGSFEWPARPQG
jgi:hypothetical protein